MTTIRDIIYLLIADYWKSGGEICSLATLSGRENRFAALIHFKQYAYERNVSGAAAAYRRVADIALSPLKTGDWLSDGAEGRIWGSFIDECGRKGIGPNAQVNPLKPSQGKKKSLFAFVRDRPNDETIADWAFRMISEGKLEEAHAELKTVWGVGDKIASFYLRDIFWLGHGLNPQVTVDMDYFLQPIDIWIMRAGAALGHTEESELSLAEFISSFERSHGIAHGGANAGLWMLGSNYVRNPEKFDAVIRAMIGRSPDPTPALSIADRFENFGRFGSMLKNLIERNID